MGKRFLAFFLPMVLILCFFQGRTYSLEKPVVHFGVIPRYNPLVMYKRYQPIMDYLNQNTPYTFELKISRDYPEAVRFLRDGVTQISSLGDVTFAEANLQYAAIPFLKPLNPDGKPFYRSAVIVRTDSPLKTLKDLRGKTFAFGSAHSTSGNLIPRYLLWDNGVKLQDLKSFANLKNHDAAAKAILKGQYDAGAVKDVVAEKYKRYGLRVLALSQPIPSVPFVMRYDAPDALIKSVSTALLRLDPKNPEHKKIMATWDDEFRHGFASASKSDYQGIFRMIREIPQGCGIGCHK